MPSRRFHPVRTITSKQDPKNTLEEDSCHEQASGLCAIFMFSLWGVQIVPNVLPWDVQLNLQLFSLTALVAFLELLTPSASSPLSTTYLIMPGKVHSTWSADVQYWCELKQCNIREDTEIHKQDENPSTSKGLRSPSLVYLLGTLLILLFSFIISYSHIVCSLLFLIFFSFSFLYISLFFLPLFISSSDNVKSSTFYWTFILLILIFL